MYLMFLLSDETIHLGLYLCFLPQNIDDGGHLHNAGIKGNRLCSQAFNYKFGFFLIYLAVVGKSH